MDGENNGKPYSNGWFGGTIIFRNTHVGQELHHIFPPWCHLRLFQFVGHVKNPVCVMRLRVAQTRNFTARIKDITKWIQWSMKWRRACRPWREVLDLSAPQLYCLVGVRSVLDSSKTRYSQRTTNSIDFSQTKSKEMKTWHLVHQSWGSFPVRWCFQRSPFCLLKVCPLVVPTSSNWPVSLSDVKPHNFLKH